jgi:biotin carboxylase
MPLAPQNDQVVVLVDAFGSAGYLAPALLGDGVRCVHVSTSAQTVGALRNIHSPEFYLADLADPGDLDALTELLAPYRVGHVLPGLETGVELAADLAERLATPTRNVCKLARARRDKAAMLDALDAAGVPVRRHREVASVDAALAWADEAGSWPVVVKPTASAGTDGVLVCPDRAALARNAAAVLGRHTVFGSVNDTVLVEEFLAGPEYMVNTASSDGSHRILEIWRTVKQRQNDAQVYDYFELVDPRSAEGRRIGAPIDAVLDALGYRWGPSHLEVIDAPGGVQLVECAPRFHGGVDLSATMRALGGNHITETVHALLSPATFHERPRPARDTSGTCCSVVLLGPRDGVLARDPGWARFLRGLATFHSMKVRWSLGQRVARTHDIFTSAGNVYLVGDAADVAADRERVRAWSRDELARCIDEVPDDPA